MMPTPKLNARLLAAAALVLSAACADRSPTAVAPAPPPGREVRAQIECTVAVQEGWARCGEPGAAGAGARSITLGGQGTYVRLQSAHAGYDDDVFSLDVTVQNLLSQRMGTPDGTTVSGVKVFFAAGPETTEGEGDVTVANPDGTGTFTAMGQPYYAYAEILEPRGASAPRTWRFNVPGTATRFRFTVYVHTELPAEQGVLRWLPEQGPTGTDPAQTRGLWGASARDVFAVGLRGRILHYDGSHWARQASGTFANLRGVWGGSRSNVYAVGDSGTILHYDGNRWSRLQGGIPGRSLTAVWGRGDTLYVVGYQGDPGQALVGLILRSTDGGHSWQEQLSPAAAGTRRLWGVHGGDAGRVYVTGAQDNTVAGTFEAVILSTADGGATWSERIVAEETGRQLYRAWAHGAHVFAAGAAYNAVDGRWEGLVMRSADGGATWAQDIHPGTPSLLTVWGTSPADVTAVGEAGTILRFDGGGWADESTGGTATLQGVWGSSGSDLWAAGNDESFARNTGSGWSLLPALAPGEENYVAIWGRSADELYVAARRYDHGTHRWGTSLLRRTGQTWSTVRPWEGWMELGGVWGTDGGVVIAVGHRYAADAGRYEGVMLRYDGTAWTETTSVGGADRRFNAIHGDGTGNLWVVGHSTADGGDREALILHSTDDGATWTETRIPMSPYMPQLFDVWASEAGEVHAVGSVYSTTTAGSYGLIVRYDGTAWTYEVLDADITLNTVWGSETGTVFAGGHTGDDLAADRIGLILASADRGATWTSEAIPPTFGNDRTVHAMWGSADGSTYAVGTGGGILHHDGARWEETGAAEAATLTALWGFSATDVYAMGSAGAILHGIR